MDTTDRKFKFSITVLRKQYGYVSTITAGIDFRFGLGSDLLYYGNVCDPSESTCWSSENDRIFGVSDELTRTTTPSSFSLPFRFSSVLPIRARTRGQWTRRVAGEADVEKRPGPVGVCSGVRLE